MKPKKTTKKRTCPLGKLYWFTDDKKSAGSMKKSGGRGRATRTLRKAVSAKLLRVARTKKASSAWRRTIYREQTAPTRKIPTRVSPSALTHCIPEANRGFLTSCNSWEIFRSKGKTANMCAVNESATAQVTMRKNTVFIRWSIVRIVHRPDYYRARVPGE